LNVNRDSVSRDAVRTIPPVAGTAKRYIMHSSAYPKCQSVHTTLSRLYWSNWPRRCFQNMRRHHIVPSAIDYFDIYRFTTSKRWQTAWRVTLETVGMRISKTSNKKR
jgi:hypothetical protein